ncbi:hypothetical protein SAMN05216176_101349 [Nitratireductor indicus]|nr:hypothetical protein SAMN05216176_101349 [Nitratireductor indicus]
MMPHHILRSIDHTGAPLARRCFRLTTFTTRAPRPLAAKNRAGNVTALTLTHDQQGRNHGCFRPDLGPGGTLEHKAGQCRFQLNTLKRQGN